MKLPELLQMCEQTIARYNDPDLPTIGGAPMLSLVIPTGNPLPDAILGVPYQRHSGPRGTNCWVNAVELKRAIDYLMMEGAGKDLDGTIAP
jgi:hypothetical protein